MKKASHWERLSEVWTYNGRQQPTQLQTSQSGATVLTLGWGYGGGADSNNNGNVTSHTIQRSSGLASSSAVLMENFGYADASNRLTSASEGGCWSQSHQYDAFGNRTVRPGCRRPDLGETLPNPSLTPQAQKEFKAQNQWKSGAGDQCDAVGNERQIATNTAPYDTPAYSYQYDGENRLTAFHSAGGDARALSMTAKAGGFRRSRRRARRRMYTTPAEILRRSTAVRQGRRQGRNI